jgi:hypothetical protein
LTALASWATLHDAVITALMLQFPGRSVTVELDSSEGPLCVRGEETTLLTCPQANPWGLSKEVYVNEARHARTPDGDRLEVETQNGDVIIIEAKRIYLEAPAIPQAGVGNPS